MDKDKIKKNIDQEDAVNHEPYLLQLSIKAVIYDKEKDAFLLVKDVNEDSFFSTHFGPWELAGGRLQKGESIIDCLKREIKEELGNDFQYELEDMLGAAGIEYRTGKAVASGYLVFYSGGEIKLSPEHSEYKWESARTIEENSDYKPWLKNLVKRAVRRMEERQYLDGWKRCQADFENYKKRQAENQKNLVAYANINLITEILPVLDNFHASTEHIPSEQKENAWVTGIMHIQKQLEKVLEDNNVSEIKIKPGDKFDPEMMEAIENKECPPEKCKNVVKKIVTRGYRMGEKVIRAGRVTVE
jgi:molecular chaperone GrpE